MNIWRQARWLEDIIPLKKGFKNLLHVLPYEDEFKDVDVNHYLPEKIVRRDIDIPAYPELEVVRHYVRLSQESYGVNTGTVPLGSCTMKYNPKINDVVVKNEVLEELHPETPEELVQGLLEILWELEQWLKEITGMDRCSFQVPAGAAGELAGALIIRQYHIDRGENRDEMLVPDSAHGTNPASAAMAGFKVVTLPTDTNGNVDTEALKASVSRRTAGLMLTNPNTLGLFEEHIDKISDIIHGAGGLLYYDGANLNGILGVARPGDMGFDIVHLNLHKTFSAPHGGGGPGGAAICVKKELEGYLPRPLLTRSGGRFVWDYSCDKCIGMMRVYYGNIIALLRTYLYILMLGPQGLREVCEVSVLNTNYLMKKLLNSRFYELPYGTRPRKHEVVFSARKLKKDVGVTAEDVAKALLDRGLHAPTIYFPLIVEEALMIELTESESIYDIERYVEALIEIAKEAYRDPQKIKNSPKHTTVSRLDLAKANHPRTLVLSTKYLKESS